MLTKVVVVVVVVVAAALAAEREGEREKRQVHCASRFELASNPCQTVQGQKFYPIPEDNTKFVECDVMGRPYVIQCPSGMDFNQVSWSCQEVVTTPTALGVNSVCTPQAIRSGNIYFPYPGRNTYFYQCIGVYQAMEMPCTPGTVWDNSLIACAFPSPDSGPITDDRINTIGGGVTNPCTVEQLTLNHHYFAHPNPSMFIQCDNTGQGFEMQCPSGLVWNQYAVTCVSIYSGLTSVVG